jgi:hypothetical protein
MALLRREPAIRPAERKSAPMAWDITHTSRAYPRANSERRPSSWWLYQADWNSATFIGPPHSGSDRGTPISKLGPSSVFPVVHRLGKGRIQEKESQTG